LHTHAYTQNGFLFYQYFLIQQVVQVAGFQVVHSLVKSAHAGQYQGIGFLYGFGIAGYFYLILQRLYGIGYRVGIAHAVINYYYFLLPHKVLHRVQT
jgi:hypothetical protein